MNRSELPALVDAIHAELGDGAEHTEYALLKKTAHLDIFSLCASDATLGLFQKHFILKHALYVLRRDLFDAELGVLEIDGTRMRLLPWHGASQAQQVASATASEKLEAYYLDFSNLVRESESSVASMLGQFWRKYGEHAVIDASTKQAALDNLGLRWPFCEKSLKRAFREKAHALHPDKGGDPEAFIELRRNYETLKNVLSQSHSEK